MSQETGEAAPQPGPDPHQEHFNTAHAEPPRKVDPSSSVSKILAGINLAMLLVSIALVTYLVHEQRQMTTQEQPVKEEVKEATKAEDRMKPEVAQLQDQIRDLSRKLDERPTPPDPGPRLKMLEDRNADLGRSLADMTDRLDSLGKKLDAEGRGEGLASSPPVEALNKKVGEIAAAFEIVKVQVAALTSPKALASDQMGRAVSLFKDGQFAEAKDAFVKLQAVMPDDARVWYYSALANGLATRDWKGASERWVSDGMAREKAGKPDHAAIDSAFSDLTPATGKDWLSFYRDRAKP